MKISKENTKDIVIILRYLNELGLNDLIMKYNRLQLEDNIDE